ncbi:MAG TPA: terminase family protein [Polyangiaceae bacterium]|nr:terminase family protein [Polyangiaceae bacterium]
MDLAEWQEHERRIASEQIPDGEPLLDRLTPELVRGLSSLECLSLKYSPSAYLRPRQITPSAGGWLACVFMAGRGFGKSVAAAAWVVERVLEGHPSKPADYVLVAPTLDECWSLQWRVIRDLMPPWIRAVERAARNEILFPDQGVRLAMHSAEVIEYRGPNLRGAWCEEPTKWPSGATLFRNLRLALRVRGETPPRAILTTTPPREANWILDLCAEPTTRVVTGTMRDNPTLDPAAVEALYASMAGTSEGARELDGRVVLGVDGSLFKVEDLERFRVASAPRLEQVVIAVDPAQSARKDADPVGLVALGIASGDLYILASCSERLEPAQWTARAIQWADLYGAGRYIVEPTGSGAYPRATLEGQIRIFGARRLPIVESPAKGSKADRAQPLSAACAAGRVHLVGRKHEALVSELTTWFPGARFSPGALDALVHAAAALTNDWKKI